MSFKQLAIYLDRLEQTASRNQMTAVLAELLKKLKPAEARPAVHLCLGQLAPAYAGLEINMAEKLMLRVLAKAYGQPEKKLVRLYKEKGDLGSIAQALTRRPPSRQPSVSRVYQALLKIARAEGPGSVERKITAFAALLKKLDGRGARFVVRIPLAKLRLGFSELTVLDALSLMAAGDKSRRPEIERAFNVAADIGQIVELFKAAGLAGLKKIRVSPGIPVRMAAAERLPNAQKIIEKIGAGAVEPKYDGFRVQIHITKKQKGEKRQAAVKIFSRNLENTTAMFPDIAAASEKLSLENAILEGEAVGFNPATNEFRPFQETMQRKRKHDIRAFAKTIPLKVFAFDLLYLNKKSLLTQPYTKRRAALEKILPASGKDKPIVATPSEPARKAATIERLFDKYVTAGLEGVMVKKLDAPYRAGARGFHWIKFKRAMHGELVDTIDTVVMGYYRGRGKRSAFGIGAFLVGVYDDRARVFRTVAKIGTGLTDDEWRQMKKRADRLRSARQPARFEVIKNLRPDVWTRPALVVEIQADEITKSPIHTAAPDKKGVGLALRFPRLIRFRDDKKPEQATTEKELLKLFKMQKSRQGPAPKK